MTRRSWLRRLRSPRGSAVAVALGISTVLLIVGAGTATYVLNQLHATGQFRQRVGAFYLADAGVANTLAWFSNQSYTLPATTTYFSTGVPVTLAGTSTGVVLPTTHPNSYTDYASQQKSGVVTSFNSTVTNQPLGSGRISVTATLISLQPEQWQLLSTGTQGGVQQQVGALVRRHANGLFPVALYGLQSVKVSGGASTDSYDSVNGGYGGANILANGDVRSEGGITLTGSGTIHGNATPGVGSTVTMGSNATVTGSTAPATQPLTLPPVSVPSGAAFLGSINLSSSQTQTIKPGTYLASTISITGQAVLTIDNSAGPVYLYVTGSISAGGNGIVTTGPDTTQCLIFAIGGSSVSMSGNGSFRGGVYAPDSDLTISGKGDLYGGFVGKSITVTGSGGLHYDQKLTQVQGGSGVLHLVAWWRLPG